MSEVVGARDGGAEGGRVGWAVKVRSVLGGVNACQCEWSCA